MFLHSCTSCAFCAHAYLNRFRSHRHFAHMSASVHASLFMCSLRVNSCRAAPGLQEWKVFTSQGAHAALGRHISLLSLQRERARVRVSSRCCQRSARMSWEKCRAKNRMPCHAHKERQSPDDTFLCQISVIKMPPSPSVGKYLKLGARTEGRRVMLCDIRYEKVCLCTSLSVQIFGITSKSSSLVLTLPAELKMFFDTEIANTIIWWVLNGPAVTTVQYHCLSLMNEAFIGQ